LAFNMLFPRNLFLKVRELFILPKDSRCTRSRIKSYPIPQLSFYIFCLSVATCLSVHSFTIPCTNSVVVDINAKHLHRIFLCILQYNMPPDVMSFVKQVCDLHTVTKRTACSLIIFDVLANMPEILAMIFVTDLKMVDLLTETCNLNIVYL
jgi:hypothetical protein